MNVVNWIGNMPLVQALGGITVVFGIIWFSWNVHKTHKQEQYQKEVIRLLKKQAGEE